MILGLDTDVVVAWIMAGNPRHETVRRTLSRRVNEQGALLGLAPQVLQEFLHVTTDARRFETSLPMNMAVRIARRLWDSREVVHVLPTPQSFRRTLDLMHRFRLGRKRILDTALAATYESAGVKTIFTLNPGDFEVFSFLDLVDLDVV
jgi:predicted nucleic acid-binding protein